MSIPFDDFIKQLQHHRDLSGEQALAAFDAIFTGGVGPDDIGAFLLALHHKGESTDEIRGAVESMRGNALTINAPDGAIDIVGTGGDGHNTLNISTATALVVAACGVPVAKHGNRAATSRSGSSDVLAALGVHLEPPFAVLEQSLAEANLCFLFAPRHHPAMRHVAEVRRDLGVRTIFNLLGPLTNPANVKRHLIGVYDAKWCRPIANVLDALGSNAAWITHGHDGMDELSLYAANDVAKLTGGLIDDQIITPENAGLDMRYDRAELQGGDAAFNAAALKVVLDGAKNAYRDCVLFNAAAALVVAERAPTLRHGCALAAEALDSGAARDTLEQVIKLSHLK